MKRILAFAGIAAAVSVLVFRSDTKPRVLAVNEVPVAYWAWLGNVPRASDLEKALTATKTRTLFLRAGQFDSVDGRLERIRPAGGTLPSGVELHLAYNATRRFLQDLDSLETIVIADAVIRAFNSDLARAHRDNAHLYGLQLDFDVPNRLLPKYGVLLREVREKLPPGAKLSITGLPTWTTTHDDLRTALAPVDFWIPQCYGGEIPAHLGRRIPIASPSEVARTTANVRKIGKPFYAGLAAYGYTILYSKDGNLIELRGNIDPERVDRHPDLELIERRPFGDENGPREMRYEYRARNEMVLNGLSVQTGETIVLDQPSSASLRAAARSVRENGGELLLGICVFRLPTSKDHTVLGIGEITAALNDAETTALTELSLEATEDHVLRLTARNSGTAASLLGEDAFTIELDIPEGKLRRLTNASGFHETLCRAERHASVIPCSPNRANVIRLRSRSWRKGSDATITFELAELPHALPASITTRIDDGRVLTESFELIPTKNEKQIKKN